MQIRQIRLSEEAKKRLSRLKGKTGIRNWNVLCRWAFCYSIREDTVPCDDGPRSDSNLEMSWTTFGGEYAPVYEILILAWCLEKQLPTDDETLAKYFRLHLERGIAHLAGTNTLESLEGLLSLTDKAER